MPAETPASIDKTVALAKHYAPDLAFFLAIAPWPYAEMYEELKPYIRTDDYRRYNLVEPVLRTEAMSLDELNEHMLRATKEFYVDKMQRLDELTEGKRAFMVKVMMIMAEHSYLGDMMRSAGGDMPPHVRTMLDELGGKKPL
jgi:anaerobic magnesium-protoporphyrin IX monomethyl ester cyclase